MPEAPDGQASAADFDFYEDVGSSLPIGVTAVTAPPSASSLPHPCLQELDCDVCCSCVRGVSGEGGCS